MLNEIVKNTKKLNELIETTANGALEKSGNSNKKARNLLLAQMVLTADEDSHQLVELTVNYLKDKALSV